MEFKMRRHLSPNLSLNASSLREDCFNDLLLLSRREVNNGTELPFGHDGRGQGIAEGDNGLQDLRGKAEKPQHLGHTGAGDPQLTAQISRRGTVSVSQSLLPFSGKRDGVTIGP